MDIQATIAEAIIAELQRQADRRDGEHDAPVEPGPFSPLYRP